MPLVKVFVRRSAGNVEEFEDLGAARGAALDGDVIGKVHRGGHVDYEAAMMAPDGQLEFIDQPTGWRPRLPPKRG